MRRVLRPRNAVVFVLVTALALIAAAGWYLFGHSPVNPESLKSAVERESGSQGGLVMQAGRCRERRPDVWRCEVVDSGSSGMATYEIQVGDGSCWTGHLDAPVGEPMPSRISGCVLHRD
jgi:hypothetical protein